MKSIKHEIVIRENSLYDNSTSTFDMLDKESHLEVVYVIITDVTVEIAMVEMERQINLLIKVVDERHHEITFLKDHIKAREIVESSQTSIAKVDDKEKVTLQKNRHNIPSL